MTTTAPTGINSTPTPPPQPALPTYTFAQLALVPTYTRAGVLAATGTQQVNWNDPSLPPALIGVLKNWSITGLTAAQIAALMVPDLMAQAGSAAEKPLTITDPVTGQPRALTVAEAAAMNIPGLQTYTAYAPVENPAIVNSAGAILNPNYLSTFPQAVAMCAALGIAVSFGGPGATIVDMDGGGVAAYTYPAGETRRQYGVIYNGLPLNVGILLVDEYQNGVGAPGAWVGGAWVPTPPPAQDGITTGVPATSIPVPVRPLLATEYFEPAPFEEILNTTLVQPPSAGGGTTGTGDYTAVDRARDTQTAASVAAILTALGIAQPTS